MFVRFVTLLATAATLLAAGGGAATVLPWEMTVAEIEAGRLRHLAQRLNKQNVLYHLRLGDVSKQDLVKTADEIEQIIAALEHGVPAHSIPAPWTDEINKLVSAVDSAWSPVRAIAVASPYEHLRVAREFLPRESRRGDPLLLKYFDSLSETFVQASEKLVDAYDAQCQTTGLATCTTARTSGYAAMLIERLAKEAVYLVAAVDPKESRARLEMTIEEYKEVQRTNNVSEFFKEALDPKRGISAKAAGELLQSLRRDWEIIQEQVTILSAGDAKNFDLQILLRAQKRMVSKVERLAAALLRYANFVYGS